MAVPAAAAASSSCACAIRRLMNSLYNGLSIDELKPNNPDARRHARSHRIWR